MRTPLILLRFVVLAALTAAIILPGPALAAGPHTVVGTDKLRAAEARLLRDVNRIRRQNGRKPLRLDKATSQVARARSSDMAVKHYFAHVEPDGDNARRILRRRRIPAQAVTENIGHTIGLTLRHGSARMASWWYHSPPHRRQMLARDINYVGIGIAHNGGRYTYTAIFTRSRDKTRPHVVIDRAGWRPSEDGPLATIDWHGVDPRLATGRTGIRRYEVQRFSPLTGWTRVAGDRQASRRTLRTLGPGGKRFRVRAVDKAGNVGAWAYARIVIPARLPRWM